MSPDEEARALARLAGEGDLPSARRLVELLEAEGREPEWRLERLLVARGPGGQWQIHNVERRDWPALVGGAPRTEWRIVPVPAPRESDRVAVQAAAVAIGRKRRIWVAIDAYGTDPDRPREDATDDRTLAEEAFDGFAPPRSVVRTDGSYETITGANRGRLAREVAARGGREEEPRRLPQGRGWVFAGRVYSTLEQARNAARLAREDARG